jgi:glycosyltransferase involved in cell wall biosynthesis
MPGAEMPGALVLALDVWDPARGGLEAYADMLARGLAERGFAPRLLLGRAPVEPGLPHEILGGEGAGFYRRLDERFDEAGRARSDAAPLMSFRHPGTRCRVFLPLGGLLVASLASRRAAEPLALAWPRRLARSLSPRTRFFLAREKAFLETRDPDRLVLAASELIATDIRERFSGFAGSIQVTGLPIQEDRFLPAGPKLRHRLRQESLGSDKAFPVFLWVGNEPKRKGLPLARALLGRSRKRGLDARLVLAGHGTQAYDGKDPGLHGLGHVDPARLYSMGDILIAPSLEDGFHLAMVEALAAGLPAVCSSRVGASMLFNDPELARIVQDPQDLDAFDREARALCVEGSLSFAKMEARRLMAETCFLDRHLDHLSHLLIDHLPSQARRAPPR